MMRLKRHLNIVVALLFALSSYSETIGPWDVTELKQTPAWRVTELAPADGMTSILYQSIDYLGDTVEVFAYYSAPTGTIPEGGWPAAVFVHGGGGTAFPVWVEYWNNHGYACISIDVEGHIPVKDSTGARLPTPHPGPKRVGVWDDYKLPIEEQWYYHVIAQVMKAHSLIASFPEVNADKIGLLGPSWGGTITSTAMGVDDRLAWAVPIYGAGFLSESDGHQGTTMSPQAQVTFVNTYYDGSLYFENVSFPTLWVNGTNDNHFAMTCNQKSAQATNGQSIMRFENGYKHGNIYARNTEEIYAFADQVVKGGDPLPLLGKPEMNSNIASVSVQSSLGLSHAKFMYTEDDGQWNQRTWVEKAASISGNTITATVPGNATVFFFKATDLRGYMVSSEYLLITDNLALGGSASQSSTDFGGRASLAIDGNTSGAWAEGSVTHTATEFNSWWQLKLVTEKSIGEIVIYGRTDACCLDRLSDYTVTVLDSNNNITFSETYTTPPNPSLSINPDGAQGQLVKIQVNDSVALSLAEVQVFEKSDSLIFKVYDANTSQALGDVTVNINNSIYTSDNEGTVTLNLYAGTYNYTLDKEGYQRINQSLNLTRDTTIAVYLNKERFNLTFQVNDVITNDNIQGVSVAINDTVYQTDAQGQCALILEYGTYEFTLSKIGYDHNTDSLTISNDTTITKLLSASANGVELPSSIEMRTFPNPVDGILTIETANNSEYNYEIYDLRGELILTGMVNTYKSSLNISDLLPGMYLIKVADQNGFIKQKVVKK